MLKFSQANNKIKHLAKVKAIKAYLENKRKVYSLDLLSGFSCPYARDCLSKVKEKEGKKTIVDGPNTQWRCFSASQEVVYPALYNLRKNNFDYLVSKIRNGQKSLNWGRKELADDIESQLPKDLGVLRIHVGGDFFSQTYFDAMALVARRNPDKLFYAYTKSLGMWICRIGQLTDNFVLTASRGGRLDHLIDENNLRSVTVVADPIVCEKVGKLKHHKRMPKLGLPYDHFPIDHDDSHAADPSKRNQDFALLLHGIQPAGSDSGKALRSLKGIGTYGAKK